MRFPACRTRSVAVPGGATILADRHAVGWHRDPLAWHDGTVGLAAPALGARASLPPTSASGRPLSILVPSVLAIALYAIASTALGRHLDPAREPPVRWAAVAAPTARGAIAHAAALAQPVVSATALRVGVFEAASAMCWVAVLALLVGPLAGTLKDLGLAVMPLAAVAVGLAALWPADAALPAQGGLGTRLHVLVSIAAAASLILAACQAVLLALDEARLAGKRALGPPGVTPALRVRENLLFQTLWVGFFLLSLSLVSGVMFVDDLLGQHLAHKTVLSIAAWLVFTVLLWGRVRHGWRGRTAIRWTLGGFALLGLAYFGSRVVLEIVLERSWHGS